MDNNTASVLTFAGIRHPGRPSIHPSKEMFALLKRFTHPQLDDLEWHLYMEYGLALDNTIPNYSKKNILKQKRLDALTELIIGNCVSNLKNQIIYSFNPKKSDGKLREGGGRYNA